jgi:hypothetical protein
MKEQQKMPHAFGGEGYEKLQLVTKVFLSIWYILRYDRAYTIEKNILVKIRLPCCFSTTCIL